VQEGGSLGKGLVCFCPPRLHINMGGNKNAKNQKKPGKGGGTKQIQVPGNEGWKTGQSLPVKDKPVVRSKSLTNKNLGDMRTTVVLRKVSE